MKRLALRLLKWVLKQGIKRIDFTLKESREIEKLAKTSFKKKSKGTRSKKLG